MVDSYLEFNGDPRHDKKVREELGLQQRPLRKALKVLFIILFVSALLAGNTIIFHNLYFKSFFVNGQSMYPTLNLNATYKNGSLIGQFEGGSDDGKVVEYGIMDTHSSALNDIRRFDIIITTYDEFEDDDKIKRVVALPGETFYFISSDDTTNGDLYLIPNGESDGVLIPQPIADQYKTGGSYSSSLTPSITAPLTLADDEYFVLGDNRARSDDSRGHGAIKFAWIKGRAIAIEGVCTLSCPPDQSGCRATNIRLHWPRLLRGS
ncbi:MAG: signal peptidase I [Bacilli bacterium]|jgi:signal peptidase I